MEDDRNEDLDGDDDDGFVLWVLTNVELRSGLARLARDGQLSMKSVHEVGHHIDGLFGRSTVIDSILAVVQRAKRCFMVHPLRAADAMQLGAALVACGDDAQGFEFVCLDERLNEAASREGFTVRP
jgi:hypothetical protein